MVNMRGVLIVGGVYRQGLPAIAGIACRALWMAAYPKKSSSFDRVKHPTFL